MAWHQQHKVNTRHKILLSAAKLFLNKGYDAVSIDEVMRSAGLTRGAFYSHFSSKNELYTQAIETAGEKSSKSIYAQSNGANILEEIYSCYLSSEHCSGEDIQCPLAFLLTDITERDTAVRATYTQTFRKFIQKIEAQATTQHIGLSPDAALQSAVMMIGGLALARAVDDKSLSQDILQACISDLSKNTQSSKVQKAKPQNKSN